MINKINSLIIFLILFHSISYTLEKQDQLNSISQNTATNQPKKLTELCLGQINPQQLLSIKRECDNTLKFNHYDTVSSWPEEYIQKYPEGIADVILEYSSDSRELIRRILEINDPEFKGYVFSHIWMHQQETNQIKAQGELENKIFPELDIDTQLITIEYIAKNQAITPKLANKLVELIHNWNNLSGIESNLTELKIINPMILLRWSNYHCSNAPIFNHNNDKIIAQALIGYYLKNLSSPIIRFLLFKDTDYSNILAKLSSYTLKDILNSYVISLKYIVIKTFTKKLIDLGEIQSSDSSSLLVILVTLFIDHFLLHKSHLNKEQIILCKQLFQLICDKKIINGNDLIELFRKNKDAIEHFFSQEEIILFKELFNDWNEIKNLPRNKYENERISIHSLVKTLLDNTLSKEKLHTMITNGYNLHKNNCTLPDTEKKEFLEIFEMLHQVVDATINDFNGSYFKPMFNNLHHIIKNTSLNN